MKNQIIWGLLCLTGLTLRAQEKPIITVKETASNGKEAQHEDGYRVVDPNSILTLKLDRNLLYSKIADTSENKETTIKLKQLRSMLENEVEAMKTLATAIEQFEKAGKTDQSWQATLNKLSPYTNLILRDPEGQKAYRLIRPERLESMNQQYSLLFKAAALMVQNLENEMKAEAKANGTYVQLGAWIDTKKGQRALHISGFDDIAPQESYQVAQFVYLLPEDQKQEIEAISRIASVANSEGLGAALNTKNAIRQVLLSVLDTETGRSLQELENRVSSLLENSENNLGIVRSTLEKSHQELLLYNAFLQTTADKYRKPFTGSADAHLLQFNADVEELTAKTDSLHAHLTSNSTYLLAHLTEVQNNARTEVKEIASLLEELSTNLKNDIAKTERRIRDAVQVLISGENFRSEAYEFSQEVKKMTLDKLPESGTLNLETAGERDLGDALIIKLATGKGNSPLTEQQTLRYRMYFCTPYVRTAVSFLFLDPVPLAQRSENKALFQYAPSYSILLKGIWKGQKASRRSLGYHTFFSPGVGLNISSLDFNSDGAMEIGMGGTFAIFQDFLQVGYGANLFSGRGYSFFGLRLPVGSFTVR